MHSLKEIQLKCNKQFIVDFDGGKEAVKNLVSMEFKTS